MKKTKRGWGAQKKGGGERTRRSGQEGRGRKLRRNEHSPNRTKSLREKEIRKKNLVARWSGILERKNRRAPKDNLKKNVSF